MSYPKHRNSKSTRGGNRGQRYHRPSSSPPLQGNNFVNIDDGFGNGDIYANKAIVYHVTSNLGEIARIVVRNGDIYEGILKAVSPKFDCTLGEAHLIPQRKPANGLIEDERVLPNRDRLISNLLIALKDIVTVNITKSDEPDSAIDSFTDEAIAGSKHTNGQAIERPLEITEGVFPAGKTSVDCLIKSICNAPESTAEDSKVCAYLEHKTVQEHNLQQVNKCKNASCKRWM
ncbi:ataxin-2-like protein [Montipora capricornis]|uniref:ataxin-2-like protein n=1 Tax=Montipora capricornis TaxID=246305 RepID=UPI0035F15A34